jgi:hypothetical protein
MWIVRYAPRDLYSRAASRGGVARPDANTTEFPPDGLIGAREDFPKKPVVCTEFGAGAVYGE